MSTQEYEPTPTPGMITPSAKVQSKSPPPVPGIKRSLQRTANPRIETSKRLIEKSISEIESNLSYMFKSKISEQDFNLLKESIEYVKEKAEEFEHKFAIFGGKRKRSTRRMKKF